MKTKRKIRGDITVGQVKKIWAVRSEFRIPEENLYDIVEECGKMRCPQCSQGKPCELEHRSISSLSKTAAGDVIQWITRTLVPLSSNSATSEERFVIMILGQHLARASEKFADVCEHDYAGLKRFIWANWKITWTRMTQSQARKVIRGMRAIVRQYEKSQIQNPKSKRNPKSGG